MEIKTRNLKVYNQSQGDKGSVPTIILKGDWLKEIGFECGDAIEVICKENELVVKKVIDEL